MSTGQFHEVGVVTDVCVGDLVPEVELVSLVTEQLPRYRLRADTMTEFAGYRNKDWTQGLPEGSGGPPTEGPADEHLRPVMDLEEDGSNLTVQQIEHTLDYFILCGLRVSQMTRAYNDIEAVTLLLEEKERDLELAATIGKNLLEKNKELQTHVEDLEEQVRQSTEEIQQLKHELALKDGLLRIYCEDAQEAEELFEEQSERSSLSTCSSLSLSRVNVEHLQRKVQELEEENVELKIEHQTMELTANNLEEKEQNLMKDCLLQLTEANQHIRVISEELSKKTDKCMQQQEDVTCLLAKNVDLEGRLKQVATENEFLSQRLKESERSRADMSSQLADLRDKFDECLGMLAESQAESRDLRKKHRRQAMRPPPSSASSVGAGDLASELAMATRLGEAEEEGEEDEDGSLRLMESVRQLRGACHRPPPRSSRNASLADTSAAVRTADMLSLWDAESELPTPSEMEACIPGSTSFSPPRIRATEKELSAGSYLSTGSGQLDLDASSGLVTSWLSSAPEKLQIVKPLEGSETLRQWQHLATPSLSRALFDAPPDGVQLRGASPDEQEQKGRDDGEEEEEDTAFSEVEEDDVQSLSAIPTYLTSPEVSARLSRHKISSLSPTLARVLCQRGIPSQAALAAITAPSSSSSSSGEPPPPPPPRPFLQHARLAETISRVGHRLWAALQLSASATGAPLLASSPSSSSSSASLSSSLRSAPPGGISNCLTSGPAPQPSRAARVLHRTQR